MFIVAEENPQPPALNKRKTERPSQPEQSHFKPFHYMLTFLSTFISSLISSSSS